MTKFTLGVIAFCILNVLDLTSTLYLHSQGALQEINPIADYFLSQGRQDLIVFKASITAILVCILYILEGISSETATKVLVLGLAVMSAVVVWHNYLIFLTY